MDDHQGSEGGVQSGGLPLAERGAVLENVMHRLWLPGIRLIKRAFVIFWYFLYF